jgi:hypothetical protein
LERFDVILLPPILNDQASSAILKCLGLLIARHKWSFALWSMVTFHCSHWFRS